MNKIKPKQDEYAVGGSVKGTLTKKKSPPIYPKVRVGLENLPEAKKMKLGDHVKLHVHGKVSALNQGGYDNSVEIEMHHVGMNKKRLPDEDEESKEEDDEEMEDEEDDEDDD